MPLPAAHPWGTSPDYGVVDTALDGGDDHADDTPNVLGDRINQMSADTKALHDAESEKRTVTDKIAAHAVLAAENGRTFRDVGASGAPSARAFTMPITAGQRNIYVSKSGNGLRVVPASGAVKYGEASGTYIELTGLGIVELIGDGTDLIVLALTGNFDGLA